ncbi:hypothetical protein DPEC_G00214280 [Dallia pectoralis]|uniref:Uncharacterized protein n=1 Tax=Dallia pectoralis TaxID=75939 RepID=A0ACC2G271_DALPE|nr:hypothetical protein DPEC_G00214280 [Dallia pectoralis]
MWRRKPTERRWQENLGPYDDTRPDTEGDASQTAKVNQISRTDRGGTSNCRSRRASVTARSPDDGWDRDYRRTEELWASDSGYRSRNVEHKDSDALVFLGRWNFFFRRVWRTLKWVIVNFWIQPNVDFGDA